MMGSGVRVPASAPLGPSSGELFPRLAELSGVEREVGLGFAAGDAFEAVDHECEFVEVDAVELGGVAAEGACGRSGAAPIAARSSRMASASASSSAMRSMAAQRT
jgi:hypothetical protein